MTLRQIKHPKLISGWLTHFLKSNVSLWVWFNFQFYFFCLRQTCQTHGPWAQYGPEIIFAGPKDDILIVLPPNKVHRLLCNKPLFSLWSMSSRSKVRNSTNSRFDEYHWRPKTKRQSIKTNQHCVWAWHPWFGEYVKFK